MSSDACFGNGQLLDGNTPEPTEPCCVDYGFFAYRTSNQTIGGGVNVALDFTAKRNDPSGMYNLTTDYAVIPVTGRWAFAANIEVVYSARAQGFLRMFRNGSDTTGTYYGSQSDETSIAGTCTPLWSFVDWFSAGETLKLYFFQNSGFSASAIGCCNQIWFGGGLIYQEVT